MRDVDEVVTGVPSAGPAEPAPPGRDAGTTRTPSRTASTDPSPARRPVRHRRDDPSGGRSAEFKRRLLGLGANSPDHTPPPSTGRAGATGVGRALRNALAQVRDDSLVRNSGYLMLSTVVMAALGFVFWFICARMFTVEDVGIATTLISSMTLVSYVGLLGFNSTFVRELPGRARPSVVINTGFMLAAAVSLLAAGLYVAVVPALSAGLDVLRTPWFAAGFVVLAVFATLNLLSDSVFLAFRAAKYNFYIDGLFMSGLKVLLPSLFVGAGAFGIFASAGLVTALAFGLSVVVLVRRFGYSPRPDVDRATVREVGRYSSSNYVSNLLNIAPTQVLPLLVISGLGAAQAGYFSLAFMVANLLYTTAYAVAQSLFAEGSHDDRPLGALVVKAAATAGCVLVPAGAAAFVLAGPLLGLYGPAYGTGAAGALRTLVLAAPAVAFYVMVTVLLRIRKKLVGLVVMDVVYVVAICGLALAWTHRGLEAVALAWLVGNLLSGAVGLVLLRDGRKRRHS